MSVKERYRGLKPLDGTILHHLNGFAPLFARYGIRLAYLFGSAARPTLSEPSPEGLDLAVLAEGFPPLPWTLCRSLHPSRHGPPGSPGHALCTHLRLIRGGDRGAAALPRPGKRRGGFRGLRPEQISRFPPVVLAKSKLNAAPRPGRVVTDLEKGDGKMSAEVLIRAATPQDFEADSSNSFGRRRNWTRTGSRPSMKKG